MNDYIHTLEKYTKELFKLPGVISAGICVDPHNKTKYAFEVDVTAEEYLAGIPDTYHGHTVVKGITKEIIPFKASVGA